MLYALIIETLISGWRVIDLASARASEAGERSAESKTRSVLNIPVNTGKMATVALKEVDSNDVPDVSNLNSG